jgi:hypothetical protein
MSNRSRYYTQTSIFLTLHIIPVSILNILLADLVNTLPAAGEQLEPINNSHHVALVLKLYNTTKGNLLIIISHQCFIQNDNGVSSTPSGSKSLQFSTSHKFLIFKLWMTYWCLSNHFSMNSQVVNTSNWVCSSQDM